LKPNSQNAPQNPSSSFFGVGVGDPLTVLDSLELSDIVEGIGEVGAVTKLSGVSLPNVAVLSRVLGSSVASSAL
jgi:hypothetical protein